MIEALQSHLLQNWESLFPAARKPKERDLFALQLGRRETGPEAMVTFGFFAKRNSVPTCMVKVMRHPDQTKLLEREFEILIDLRRHYAENETWLRSLPVPLRLISIENHTALLFLVNCAIPSERKIVAGSLRPFGKGAAKRLVKLWSQWLSEFQRMAARKSSADNSPAKVENALAYLRAQTGKESQAVIRAVEVARETRNALSITPVASHGNLSPQSILVSDGGVQVLDWQSYQPSAHPLNDPADLVFSTVASVPNARTHSVPERLIDPRFYLRPALVELLSDFRFRLGLSPERTHHCLVLRAAERFDQALRTDDFEQQPAFFSLLQDLVRKESEIVALLSKEDNCPRE